MFRLSFSRGTEIRNVNCNEAKDSKIVATNSLVSAMRREKKQQQQYKKIGTTTTQLVAGWFQNLQKNQDDDDRDTVSCIHCRARTRFFS
ncbi:unnamed protein product [Sphagnum jensenii]|uniref:Uncharacterized protein n=1 Tax=Sphagnum jensenii TaxID=128206 RepID=A0ABP0X6U9_9BRYO